MDPDDERNDVWGAPLPAHERPWRHPSEIAELVALDDTASGSSRLLVVLSGAVGLVLVATLAVVITPSSHSTPLAVESTVDAAEAGDGPLVTIAGARLEQELTVPAHRPSITTVAMAITTLVRPVPAATPEIVSTIADTTLDEPPASDPPESTTTTMTSVAESMTSTSTPTSASTPNAAPAYATPLGDGTTAVVLGLLALDSTLTVVLPSGQSTTATVIEPRSAVGVSLVALASRATGYEIARTAPAPDTMVTVMGGTPARMAFAELAAHLTGGLEGAPVVDDGGALVGICHLAAPQGIIPASQLGGAGATATTTTAL